MGLAARPRIDNDNAPFPVGRNWALPSRRDSALGPAIGGAAPRISRAIDSDAGQGNASVGEYRTADIQHAANHTPMTSEDRLVEDKPGHLIRRLQQIAVALFMADTKGFDVTPVQYAALLAVTLHPGIDQTALVNIIAFDRSTIGDVVARLVAKRLIRRTKGARDGRTKVLQVTAAGERLLREIEPRVRAAQRHILAPLAPAERTEFVRMLRKLVSQNNEHSRVPVRQKSERGRRAEPARTPAKAGSAPRAAGR